jgi:hypothetical protein
VNDLNHLLVRNLEFILTLSPPRLQLISSSAKSTPKHLFNLSTFLHSPPAPYSN